MVPIPRASSWEELNAHLEPGCRKRRELRLRGHKETIAERFERDRAALLPLPAAPYEACEKISFDVVRHLVLCRIERRPPRLDLQNWPHLPLPRGTNHHGCRLHDVAGWLVNSSDTFEPGGGAMNEKQDMPTPDTPQVLLEHHLKVLRLPGKVPRITSTCSHPRTAPHGT